MKKKEQKKIMRYVWLVTDIIIIICAILLLVEGGTFNIVLAVIGILLVISEVILFRRGYLKSLL